MIPIKRAAASLLFMRAEPIAVVEATLTQHTNEESAGGSVVADELADWELAAVSRVVGCGVAFVGSCGLGAHRASACRDVGYHGCCDL
jgi:hypothetical protein